MSDIPETKPSLKTRGMEGLDPGGDDIWQAKLDGAFMYYKLDPEGIRAFSYRRSKKTGEPIEHTDKIVGLAEAKIPKNLQGSILQGEAWHPNLESREVGGILNTRRPGVGHGSLRPALHGVTKIPGVDLGSLTPAEHVELVKSIAKQLGIFDLPDMAATPEDKMRLLERIKERKHEQTYEGIVGYPTSGKPYKAVVSPTYDVPVAGSLASESPTFRGRGASALLVGKPDSYTRVGTGLSHKMRQVIHQDPEILKGLVARVEAKEQFPSGRLRAPRLKDFHPEKSDPEAYARFMEAMKNPSLGTMKKQAKKEFAPGIPLSRDIQPIPASKGDWELSIQQHLAERAGPHYDLRLGDPSTGHGHSWALPKSMLPDEKKRMRLAVQQPTHSLDYFGYEGEIPKGTYGAGTVKLVRRGKVSVVSDPNRIAFNIPDEGKFVLRRKGGKNWMLIKKKEGGVEKVATRLMLQSFTEKVAEQISEESINWPGLGAVGGAATGGILSLSGSFREKPVKAMIDGKPITAFIHGKKWEPLIRSRLGKAGVIAGLTAAGYGAGKAYEHLTKEGAFESHNKPRLNTRLTPFRNDVSKKLKPRYTVEAPAKNVVSTGKADSGPISAGTGGNSSGGGAP